MGCGESALERPETQDRVVDPVRPIHGWDVARRTASEHGTTLDSDSDAPLARVGPRLGTRHEDCPQSRVLPRATLLDSDSDAPVMSTAVCGQLLDALEEDLMQPVIPQKKRVRRRQQGEVGGF